MKSSFFVIISLFILIFSCKTTDKKVTIEDVSKELLELEQANAYSNSKIEELSSRIGMLQEEIELNRQALEEIKDVAAKVQAEKNKPKEEPKKAKGPNPTIVYQTSLKNFNKKDYEKALAGFQSFILNFPKHEFVANAHYWIGEIYFERGEFKSAIENYGKIPEEYPLTDKVDSAILKMGFSYLKLKEKDQAIIKFKEVVELYPNSSSAMIAKKQLEGLK